MGKSNRSKKKSSLHRIRKLRQDPSYRAEENKKSRTHLKNLRHRDPNFRERETIQS